VRADELDIPHATWVSTHPVMISWRAYMTAATGQTAAAAAACAELVELFGERLVPEENVLPVLLGLASAAADIGDGPAIETARDALAAHAGQHGIYYVTAYWGSVDHHLGRLAAAAGDLDAAVEHLTAGVLAHRRAGARPYEALSQHARAAALWHRNRPGDRKEAELEHRAVVIEAGQLGMPRLAAAAWPPPPPGRG
jgi:hypothetical protein